MQTIIYCPKCQSRKVETERVSPLPQPLAISMDELAQGIQGSHAHYAPLVLRNATWRATCGDCGYFVEYQSIDG